ncbi:MFS transporter [Niallia endozanthoxylica]|uniref:Aromatic acid/H+ symport family MFS transporter n=1 Tax=Niallia endozanthoxylica TaxID=2036016 RepID=A0A5J5HQ43_9BACI|nr:aromatic acid/H+ symport family MFS transporter [Niallia endozanthoxylica]KAA9022561.1 aromatic acid/H+ symport family MFS transporter [Niallia endozanthoxylica]
MRSINVSRIVDESKFNRFHGLVLFLCAFVIVCDGFDLVIYGSVVSVLMEEWQLTAVQAGTLGSYALIGMMFGAFIFAPLADKIGRKKVIILCVILLSLFTGLIGLAKSPAEFGIYRFISGLGLGGVLPITVALMTEYAPKSLRNRMVTIMMCGYSLGGILAAGLAIFLLPRFGWESIFFVGALPLLTLPILIKLLPESLEFLLAKNKYEEIGHLLAKIDPSYTPQTSDRYERVMPKKTGITVTKLFGEGRAVSTILFWVSFFMCLLMVYGLNTWLPKLMAQAGYALGSSIMFLLVLNVGAIAGSVFGGWAADRWNTKKVVIFYFILGGIALTLLGTHPNTIILYTLVAIAGATTIGTQIILYSYVSQYYPIQIRSTGLGWASGVGRIGGIVGPILGGFLLGAQLPLQMNFLAFAIPGVIAAIAVFTIREKKTVREITLERPEPIEKL